MGNLGFLFNINNKQIIIFTESVKFEKTIILGFENLQVKTAIFYFINLNFKLKDFLIFDEFVFKYSKIKLFNEKIIDYKDFLFFLKPKEYKKLKSLFLIEDSDFYFNSNLNNKIINENITKINNTKFNSNFEEILIKNTIEIYNILN